MKFGSLVASALLALSVPAHADPLSSYNYIVVIYEENHSFDNLYGSWGAVGGYPVNGRLNADAAHSVQVRQDDQTKYKCLMQQDVNLAAPAPLPASCGTEVDKAGNPFQSAFPNAPFDIGRYIPPTATNCPTKMSPDTAGNGILIGSAAVATAATGGCTRDIVHRFYQNQYQIHDGLSDRYVTGSDATGLTMGYYESRQLPIYRYLHAANAPHYVVADNFFQGAFGGSFLNHQWLIAAATPVYANAANDGGPNDLHSVVDLHGMPTNKYPLYVSPLADKVLDKPLTVSCNPPAGRPATPPDSLCGDYAVNTMQPGVQPSAIGPRLPLLKNPTIGDRLTDAKLDWAWYAGGWDNAAGIVDGAGWTNGNQPGKCLDPGVDGAAQYPYCQDHAFQTHHQPFNYFEKYASGPERAAHLKDEKDFLNDLNNGELKTVSFIKPQGEENEHPGYASETGGSNHLVSLIDAIVKSPQADETLIIVTYDEFGGQWDHVPPPGNGPTGGAHDQFGPGTRVPTLIIAKNFRGSSVDHVPHDTTSILSTIEHRFDLEPLGNRDAAVSDLTSAILAANR